MTEVPAHVVRMQEEHKELIDRLLKLNAFIHGNERFPQLPAAEQRRMHTQAAAMKQYAEVLQERINAALGED